MTQRRIGIRGYDGMPALDLVGPAEAFAAVRGRSDRAALAQMGQLGRDRAMRLFSIDQGLHQQGADRRRRARRRSACAGRR